MRPTYLKLFFTFLKIGAFTFGGGYAMISIIENELVVRNRWIDRDTFYEYLSMAQMSPGILAVNISILLGNRLFGKKGAVLCVIATCIPAFFIILLIAFFFVQYKENQIVNKVFRGIRPIVVALLLVPVISMCKKAKINFITILIPIFIVIMVAFFKVSPVYIIAISIVIAMFFTAIRKK